MKTVDVGTLSRRLQARHVLGAQTVALTGITHDSRRAQSGFVYVAVPGLHSDGREHVRDAVEHGASAVMMEPPPLPIPVPQILVPSAREAMALAAAVVYGVPPAQAPVIGITGTNGKTTTSYLIASILTAAGFHPMLVGSIEGRFGGLQTDAANTTPEAPDLHRFWSEAQSQGADALVMEASSHGLLLHRVDAIGFNVGVFTNLTRDHLDYHPDHAAYRGAKTRLFGALPIRGVAVLNADDPECEAFRHATRARVVTYSLSQKADVRAEDVNVSDEGIKLRILTKTGTIPVESRLFGRFNASNLLAAAAVGWSLKLKPGAISAGLAAVDAVPGRAERVDCGQPFVTLNDFAHTPDALARVLAAARELTKSRLHVVFGCGGDRDPGKRPQMGITAESAADRVIVTSDNPRTEDPDKIIEQVVSPIKGSPKLIVEKNRETAIRLALEGMAAGDTLVVAGKGHERYQIIGKEKRRFDDAEVIRTELGRMGYRK